MLKQHQFNVDSRLDAESTLYGSCLNIVCLLGLYEIIIRLWVLIRSALQTTSNENPQHVFVEK